jgi:hypothetical protein
VTYISSRLTNVKITGIKPKNKPGHSRRKTRFTRRIIDTQTLPIIDIWVELGKIPAVAEARLRHAATLFADETLLIAAMLRDPANTFFDPTGCVPALNPAEITASLKKVLAERKLCRAGRVLVIAQNRTQGLFYPRSPSIEWFWLSHSRALIWLTARERWAFMLAVKACPASVEEAASARRVFNEALLSTRAHDAQALQEIYGRPTCSTLH